MMNRIFCGLSLVALLTSAIALANNPTAEAPSDANVTTEVTETVETVTAEPAPTAEEGEKVAKKEVKKSTNKKVKGSAPSNEPAPTN